MGLSRENRMHNKIESLRSILDMHDKYPSHETMLKERQRCFNCLSAHELPIVTGNELDIAVLDLIHLVENLQSTIKNQGELINELKEKEK